MQQCFEYSYIDISDSLSTEYFLVGKIDAIEVSRLNTLLFALNLGHQDHQSDHLSVYRYH